MNILVTGATGHVGINLVRALINKGYRVKVLVHRSERGLEGLDVEKVRGDILDINSLCRACTGVDQIYHLAAHISLSGRNRALCYEINVKGTSNVITVCRRKDIKRLIHFSSIHSLEQEPLDKPVDESRPLINHRRATDYDRSKSEGEKLVRNAIQDGLNAVIINPTAIIGPYDYQPSYAGQAIILIAKGHLPVIVEGGFDWVDARDVSNGAITAAESAPPGSRYLLSGHWVSLKELAEMVCSISGSRPPLWVCPMPVARACAPLLTLSSYISGTRPLYTTASLQAVNSNHNISHHKASTELKYHPRPILQTLKDTLRWFRENGYL
jgi:dihydroflavonol-4-reductase